MYLKFKSQKTYMHSLVFDILFYFEVIKNIMYTYMYGQLQKYTLKRGGVGVIVLTTPCKSKGGQYHSIVVNHCTYSSYRGQAMITQTRFLAITEVDFLYRKG